MKESHDSTHTYKDDIEELRKQFVKVDVTDITSIQKWFADHPYLTTNDHARISGKSAYWIRSLKRKASITGKMPPVLPKSAARKAKDTLEAPKDWRNKEWLTEAAKSHSMKSIARVVGVSKVAMHLWFKKFGIKPLGNQAIVPKSPLFNYTWCYEHYVIRGWSQVRCAKAAGISKQAFFNWLNKLNIPVRSKREAANSHKDTRIWVRKAIHDLSNQETVLKVFLRDDHIHVRFKNFFWETYYLDKQQPSGGRIPHSFYVTKEDTKIERVPKIMVEYESSIDGSESYPAHITINRKEWRIASFIERRLALHDMARVINRRGWIWPKYPKRVIEADLSRIKNVNQSKYMHDGMLTAYPASKESAGFRIIEHFFGLEEIWHSMLRSPKRTMKVLNDMSLGTKHVRINFHNVIRYACFHASNRYKIKVYDPAVYYMVFKQLGFKGTVLDLNPSYGHKAMACAAAGIKYMTIPTPNFQKALDEGFAEFIGLDYEPYDGRKIDMVLNCNDLKHTNIDDALEYSDRANKILHFAERSKKAIIEATYGPSSVIPVLSIQRRKLPDYFFIF